jgi:RecA-family ATPase
MNLTQTDTENTQSRSLIPDLLPTGLVLLAGRAKIGKSPLALQIAVAVGVGGRIFGRPAPQGNVLYLALEDSARRMKHRLLKQNAPATATIQFEFTWEALFEQGGQALLSQLDRQRYSLVIIDTWARLLGTIPTGQAERLNAYLYLLWSTAIERNMTILLIDHQRKGSGDTLLDGSTPVKTGPFDLVMELQRDRGKKNATLKRTEHTIEKQELTLHFDRDTCCWECLDDAKTLAGSEREQEVLQAIARLGTPTHRELVEATGQERSNCFRRIQDLIAKGKVRQIEGRPARFMLTGE